MATLTIPAPVPALLVLTSRPSGALAVEAGLRAALVNVKDVQAWAEGASADAFSGDAADASTHALTRFSRRLDVTEAALERGVVAASRFEERLTRLASQRATLEVDRTGLNGDLDDLRADAVGATDAEIPALQSRADLLQRRAQRLLADIAAWSARRAAAEVDFIAALAAVDTLVEGRVAAAATTRTDPVDVLDRLGQGADDPEAVARWWGRLTRAERQAVAAEFPEVVGNLPGVPVRARDGANRAGLRADLDMVAEKVRDGDPLTDREQARLAHASAVAGILDDHRDEVDPVTGESIVRLTQYQPQEHSGDGGVALFLGDPDHADHVAVYVPGTLSETTTLDGTLDNLDALYDAGRGEDAGSVAIGFWLDYDAPSADGITPAEIADLSSVVTPGEAAAGGRDLADYLDGLRASDQGAAAHLSLLGHSYGATTSAHAAHSGAPVDDLVLLGSPGAPALTAAGLTSAEVYVGSADFDPVTLLGGTLLPGPLGHDPAQATFGGRRFEVDDGSYRIQDLLANHSSYFRDESLDNISAVVTGGDPDLVGGRLPGTYQTLDQLIVGTTVVSGGEWIFDRGQDAVDGVLGGVLDGVGGVVDGVTGTFGDLSEGLVNLPSVFLPGR